MSRAFGFLAALLLIGSIELVATEGISATNVREPEVRMASLAAGSSGGLNGTRGAASVAGTLLAATTNVLYLNNTNATGDWYAKLVVTSSSGVANLVSLTIGIDNGLANPQVVGALGALTQTSGLYVRLLPASTNRIYATQAVTTVGLPSTITMDVYAGDDGSDDAYVVTSATLTVS